MARIGVNAWVWTSPVNTEAFAKIAPRVKQMGFDLIEFGVEGTGDLDYKQAAAIARDLGLGASVCAAMGPDRDLIHPDESVRKSSAEYVRHCIDAAQVLDGANVIGPLYSSVGRCWQQTPDDRAKDLDILVTQLEALSKYAGDRGVTLAVEPLNRFETSFLNLAEQAIEVVDRVDHPSCGILLDTFHMNIEEKSIGDAIRAAGPRLKHLHTCENDRGAPGSGPRAVGRSRRRLPRHRLRRPVRHRVLHERGEVDRARGRHLARLRAHAGRAGHRRPALPPLAARVAESVRIAVECGAASSNFRLTRGVDRLWQGQVGPGGPPTRIVRLKGEASTVIWSDRCGL